VNNNRKIYIADDELNLRRGIKQFLEKDGYLVKDFEDGETLLKAFKEDEADIVILDVMMPGLDGYTVCQELRKISQVPVIITTAKDTEEDYSLGLAAGSDDYITKPFSPKMLAMKIEMFIRRLDYEREYAERDQMTGLYNKFNGMKYIEGKIRQMIAENNAIIANRNDKKCNRESDKDNPKLARGALFVMDIDNFKPLNDTLGHPVGDTAIIAVADSLTKLFRSTDILFRYGGDEFIAFAVDIVDNNFVTKKAEEIGKAVRKSYTDGEKTCKISASVGIAYFPEHAQTYQQLLKVADKALYKAKENGKDGYFIYED